MVTIHLPANAEGIFLNTFQPIICHMLTGAAELFMPRDAMAQLASAIENNAELTREELEEEVSDIINGVSITEYVRADPLIKQRIAELTGAQDVTQQASLRARIICEVELETGIDMRHSDFSDYLAYADHGKLKKGARVKIRKDSLYSGQCSAEGTLTDRFNGDFEDEYSHVAFDNGYRNSYRRNDLELVQAKRESPQKLESRIRQQNFDAFSSKVRQEILKAVEEERCAFRHSGSFKVGDQIQMNDAANGEYHRTKEGSEGVVIRVLGGDEYKVKFTKLTGAQSRRVETWDVRAWYMELSSLKHRAEQIGGKNALADSILQAALLSATEEEAEALITERTDAIRKMLAEKIITEANRIGLVMQVGRGTYNVSVDKVLELAGGKLAQAYSNQKLYSSKDMFSPPSERRLHVLRFELTQGCDHGGCTYCNGYKGIKYKEKTYSEFKQHYKKVIAALGDYQDRIRRVFIGGGNALSVEQKTLLNVVHLLEHKLDPNRIAIYGRADSICKKGVANLGKLRGAGLGLIYWGVESGSQQVLDYANKRVDAEQMRRAADIAARAEMQLSLMVMPGLGGVRFSEAHAKETAKFLNGVDARFITFMAVNPPQDSRYAHIMAQEMADGKNRPLTDKEVVMQLKQTLSAMKPKGQKIGMFGCGTDRVGRNPVRFNVVFDSEGKKQAIGACNKFLRAKA